MTNIIYERALVDCSPARANRYLRPAGVVRLRLVAKLAHGRRGPLKALAFAVSISPVGGGFSPTAIARVEMHGRTSDGPYRIFSGMLSCESDERYANSTLVLCGTDAPPFGVLDSARDDALGRRIASACGRELLREFTRTIESSSPAHLSIAE